MRNRIVFTRVGCIAAICTVSIFRAIVAADAGIGQAIALRFKYTLGETISYQTSGQISVPMPNMSGAAKSAPKPSQPQMGAFNIPLNSIQRIRVAKLVSSGSAELEISTTGTSPGQPGGAPSMSTIKVTASPLGVFSGGAVAASSGGGAGAELGALGSVGALGSITTYLPAKPVAPGETWTQNVRVPQMKEPARVTGTLVKLGRVGRYKTAHISLMVTIPINSMVNAKGAVTTDRAQAATTVLGKLTMKYEDDFAIQEGKLIKSAGVGSMDVIITQIASAHPGAAGAGKGMSIPVSAKITLTGTLMQ